MTPYWKPSLSAVKASISKRTNSLLQENFTVSLCLLSYILTLLISKKLIFNFMELCWKLTRRMIMFSSINQDKFWVLLNDLLHFFSRNSFKKDTSSHQETLLSNILTRFFSFPKLLKISLNSKKRFKRILAMKLKFSWPTSVVQLF